MDNRKKGAKQIRTQMGKWRRWFEIGITEMVLICRWFPEIVMDPCYIKLLKIFCTDVILILILKPFTEINII